MQATQILSAAEHTTHRLDGWVWSHKQDPRFRSISLQVFAVECNVLDHSDRVPVAADFADFR